MTDSLPPELARRIEALEQEPVGPDFDPAAHPHDFWWFPYSDAEAFPRSGAG